MGKYVVRKVWLVLARTQNVHGQIHTIDRAKRLITVLKVQVRNARSSTEKLLEFSSDERSFLD